MAKLPAVIRVFHKNAHNYEKNYGVGVHTLGGQIMEWWAEICPPHGPGVKCQSHSTLQLPTCYECLLALSNPCWTLPVGCSLVHRGRVESTINLYPAKGKVMVMSAATTSLEWPD